MDFTLINGLIGLGIIIIIIVAIVLSFTQNRSNPNRVMVKSNKPKR